MDAEVFVFIFVFGQDDQQAEASYTFGDRSTSDIVVRLRNEEGRDDWR